MLCHDVTIQHTILQYNGQVSQHRKQDLEITGN